MSLRLPFSSRSFSLTSLLLPTISFLSPHQMLCSLETPGERFDLDGFSEAFKKNELLSLLVLKHSEVLAEAYENR